MLSKEEQRLRRNAACRKWRSKNKGKHADVSRKWKMRQREILVPLTEACEICGAKPEMHLAWDHCHKTGKHRGWLCNRCNLGLGYFSDAPDTLRVAITYLETRK